MQVMHDRLKAQGAIVIGMNVISDNSRVADIWKRGGYTFPCLQDAETVTDGYSVRGLPSSFLIGRDGKIVQSAAGSAVELWPAVVQYLKQNPGKPEVRPPGKD